MFIAVRVLGGSRIAAPLSHAALLHLQSLSEGGSSNPTFYSLLQPDFPLQPESPLQPSVSLVQPQPNSGKVTSGRWGSNFSSSSSSSYSAVASQYGGFAVQTGDLPYCHVEECPSSVVQPNHDCSSEDESPFSLHVCRLDSLYVQGAMEGALVRIDASSSLVIDHRASISASGLGCLPGHGIEHGEEDALPFESTQKSPGCLPGHGEEDALRQPGGVEEGGIGELSAVFFLFFTFSLPHPSLILGPSLSPPCPLLVPSLSPPCPLLVPSLSPPCPLLVPSLSPPCPLLVPSWALYTRLPAGPWSGAWHGSDTPAAGNGGEGGMGERTPLFLLSLTFLSAFLCSTPFFLSFRLPAGPWGCPPGHGVGHGRDAPAGGSGGGGHGGKKDPFSPLSHLPVCPPFHAQPLFVFPPGCPPGHGVGHGRDAPAGGSGGGGHGGKGGAGHFNGSRAAGGAAYGRTMPPCSVGSGGGLGPEGRGNSGGGLIALCPVAPGALGGSLAAGVRVEPYFLIFFPSALRFPPFSPFPPQCWALWLAWSSGAALWQQTALLGPVARLELWGGSLAADGSFLNTRTVGGEGMGLGMGGGGVRGGERRVGSGGAGLEGKEVGMTGGSKEVGSGGVGGGAGGTVVIHAAYLNMTRGSVISAAGGQGHSVGGGGGGGGKVYFAWQNLERTRGDEYTPRATIEGNWTDIIRTSGGQGSYEGEDGEAGLTGSADCPPGLVGLLCEECPGRLVGLLCEECPVGTFKSQSGSDPSLFLRCPLDLLARHAEFAYKRGGASATPCPYRCLSSHFSLPHCDTPMEGLIRDLGGPWVFALACTLSVLLLGFAITLVRARLLLAGDDLAQPQTRDSDVSSHMDHSLPFLESLNEVMENTRVEEAASHVHRVFFCGDNSFSHPLHLPHSPPRAISDLVYEDSYNRLVDEVNAIACYRWWEGCVHSLLALLALPFAWSWQQWRRRLVVQRLREFVHTRYDHSCLRSCRSRALYEGLKVSATPDLVLGYMDVFLGGDEMATHMLPSFADRLPLLLVLGGNGSYMAPYHLFTDDLLTNIISQAIPPTVWYRLVAGLNAHLRTVSHGSLQRSLKPLLRWLCTHVNPSLEAHGVSAHLAWLQPTSASIIQLALCLDHPESTDHCNDYLPSSSAAAAAAAAADTAGHFSAPSLTSFASAAAPNLAGFGSSFGSSRLGGFGGSDTGWGRPVERTRLGGSVSALPSPRTATLSHSALPPAALPSSAFAPASLLSSHTQALSEVPAFSRSDSSLSHQHTPHQYNSHRQQQQHQQQQPQQQQQQQQQRRQQWQQSISPSSLLSNPYLNHYPATSLYNPYLFEHRPSLSILPSAEPTPGPAGSAHFAPSDKETRRGGERREVERQISSVSAGLLWQAAGGRVGKRQQGGLIDAQVPQRLDGGRGLTSLLAFALMLFVLPLAPLFSAAAGLNALFAHGARGGAGLGRVYGLWNVTSLANGVVAVTLGVFHVWQTYKGTPSGAPPRFRESAAAEEFTWLLFPAMFVACKLAQARVIDRHVANLEIQDRTLLAEDPTVFWEA
ncbi:unnamed protein product [Closterium sp. Naga37s-1]|nr:unnamed protein product [Closterium sp. Naga37s-1]